MLRIWLLIGVGVALVIGSGVLVSMATAQSQPGVDPAAVVSGYEMARNRGDIDGALAYFADDATISQRNTVFTGKDEIRKFLEGVSARTRLVVITDRRSVGNSVSWTERTGGPGTVLASPGAQPLNAVAQVPPSRSGQGLTGGALGSGFAIPVEAVVQDGKIHSLAYLTGAAPLREDPSLAGRAQLPASVGLAAVLVILLGVVMVASLGMRRAAPGTSTLQGHLMQDLQGWSAARQEG